MNQPYLFRILQRPSFKTRPTNYTKHLLTLRFYNEASRHERLHQLNKIVMRIQLRWLPDFLERRGAAMSSKN